MTAIAEWYEDNGAATGAPAKGATRTKTGDNNSRSDFVAVDSATATKATSRIIAGQNSFHKYRFVKFSGTFNEVSAAKFAHTAGSLGSGLSIVGKVTSTYATPARDALAGATNISTSTQINNGMNVQFSTTGPEGAAANKLTAAGYSQYLVTQLQTQNTAAKGDIGDMTMTLQWNEN